MVFLYLSSSFLRPSFSIVRLRTSSAILLGTSFAPVHRSTIPFRSPAPYLPVDKCKTKTHHPPPLCSLCKYGPGTTARSLNGVSTLFPQALLLHSPPSFSTACDPLCVPSPRFAERVDRSVRVAATTETRNIQGGEGPWNAGVVSVSLPSPSHRRRGCYETLIPIGTPAHPAIATSRTVSTYWRGRAYIIRAYETTLPPESQRIRGTVNMYCSA